MSMDSFHARATRMRAAPRAKPAPTRGYQRLDEALVAQGLAPSRSAAQRLIAAGRVMLAGAVVTKPAHPVADASALTVAAGEDADFVSRGGIKLAGALRHTGLSVAGKLCLDIGQSTGGFTDCLLRHGAARVVGVDVGHGQLHPKLVADARVECHEGINARHLAKSALAGRHFELIVVDVSFISLTLIIPQLPALLAPSGNVLLLVKPQFEVGPRGLGKGGLVRDPTRYPEVCAKLVSCAREHGFADCDWFASPIAGSDGNREFFLHLRHVGD